MSKIIIENNTSNYTDSGVIDFIQVAINQGEISKHRYGQSYCFITKFNDVFVSCQLLKSSTVKFRVEDNE